MKGLRMSLVLLVVVLSISALAVGCAVRLSSDGAEVVLSPVGPYYFGPFWTDGIPYWYWNGSYYIYRGGRYHFHHHAPPHHNR